MILPHNCPQHRPGREAGAIDELEQPGAEPTKSLATGEAEFAQWWTALPAATAGRIGPEDDRAPWAAYLDLRDGHPARGTALAMALRAEPLSLDPGRVSRVSDLLVLRLWLARTELRPDPEASELAAELLDGDHPISPYRRTMLHYALAAEVLARIPLRRAGDLDAASDHLHRCLGLARTLEIPVYISRCSSMLALLEVPRGNLAVAEELCRSALLHDTDPPDGPPRFGRMRALVVLQWARYYQGHPIEVAALETCARNPLVWSDPILASLLAATTALAALDSGDVSGAWRALGRAHVDRRIAGAGLWSLPVLLVEGYLAVVREDPRQTERVLDHLDLLPAPAESALIQALHLSHRGQVQDSLATVGQITSGDLPALSFTYPLASTLEAALHEELGRHEEADRCTARALDAAEPIQGLRLFTRHGLEHQRTLVRRAAAAAPQNRWIAAVDEYLDEVAQNRPVHGFDATVRTRLSDPTDAEQPAAPVVGTVSPLTSRELEVLRMVNEGAGQAQISTVLYVSLNTVKTHLSSIRRKLGVERTSEAAAVARRAGWI